MDKCNITGFGTHLKVKDVVNSHKFYESLGFKAVFVYGDEEFRQSFGGNVASAPEKYRGITYQIGENTRFEIGEDHIAIKDKNIFSKDIHTAKISAMITVDSLLPLLSNELVEINFPIRKYYWGTLEVVIRDPDGFVLVFIGSQSEYDEIKKIREIEVIEP